MLWWQTVKVVEHMNLYPDGFLGVESRLSQGVAESPYGDGLKRATEGGAMAKLMVSVGSEMPDTGRYLVSINRRWERDFTSGDYLFVATAMVRRVAEYGDASILLLSREATKEMWRRFSHWWSRIMPKRVQNAWRAAFPW